MGMRYQLQRAAVLRPFVCACAPLCATMAGSESPRRGPASCRRTGLGVCARLRVATAFPLSQAPAQQQADSQASDGAAWMQQAGRQAGSKGQQQHFTLLWHSLACVSEGSGSRKVCSSSNSAPLPTDDMLSQQQAQQHQHALAVCLQGEVPSACSCMQGL